VGRGNGAGFSGRHAILWDDGTVIDLGSLPGNLQSMAAAVNNRGDVVGRGDAVAIMWTVAHP